MKRQSSGPWADFSPINLAYLLDLYDRYRADPQAVDLATRAVFDRWGPPPLAPEPVPLSRAARPELILSLSKDEGRPISPSPNLIAGAAALANAVRTHGHKAARLDPLGGEPPGDAELRPETHGLCEEDLATLPAAVVGGPAAEEAGNALEVMRALRRVYQGSTGYEFGHVSDDEERTWLHQAVESGRFQPPTDPIDERTLLERLTEVGALERFLQRAFPSQTRFSLEGLGMMVPMLDEIIGAAAEAGTRLVVLGMAHRGRLNVLAHVLGKPYEQIIAEFLGHYQRPGLSPSGGGGEAWTGDVKYHLGARRAIRGGQEVDMAVSLAPNPSHLEAVDPVVLGMARAADERRDRLGPPQHNASASLPVLIHGDASFPAQGVVAESLNLSRLPGYHVGGTIHLIANNQLGFTTSPELGRSTLYASDLAKGFEIPIVHVNADDPQACIAAARLAHAYRERYRKDVLIDLVGYRRWGHNEGDEASFTQPMLYARVAQHPTVRELWAQEMVRRQLVTDEQAQALLQDAIERLHAIRRSLQKQGPPAQLPPTSGLEAGGPTGGLGQPGLAAEIDTTVPAATLVELNRQLYTVPPDFHLHPKLQRPFERRLTALDGPHPDPLPTPPLPLGEGRGEGRIDWAHAEALAFASILAEGTPIRLTGQDTARGTFSQRHLVLHDVETGATHTPLQALPSARASFEVWDSPLSEQAPLGFEFGYSAQAFEVLVLWEAQYGDFINSAQVIVDQFLVSARAKWGQQASVVLLLPHAHEGQGPDHSSARLERFLHLAAEDNLRIANCTTAAQYFHVLRRQAKLLRRAPAHPERGEGRASIDVRPLVLLTPKSLLRHPLAASGLEELAQGRFQPVLNDQGAAQHPRAVRRLVLCSGKAYVDLAATGKLAGSGPQACGEVAVARVEELYPFPAQEIADVVAGYPNLAEVIWLQEEPRNMGAWTYVAPRLRDLLAGRLPLAYVGRTRRASPAEGAQEWHLREQSRIVEAAFSLEVQSAK